MALQHLKKCFLQLFLLKTVHQYSAFIFISTPRQYCDHIKDISRGILFKIGKYFTKYVPQS